MRLFWRDARTVCVAISQSANGSLPLTTQQLVPAPEESRQQGIAKILCLLFTRACCHSPNSSALCIAREALTPLYLYF